MRVGSVVYATDQGLGILAKSFRDHGVVTDVAVVRHGRHQTHMVWYPGALEIADLRSPQSQTALKFFCQDMDVMLFFETPFMWELMEACRSMRVKTVLMPMHECLHQRIWTCPPDLFLCPSLLDFQVVSGRGVRAEFLPVPVEVPWRLRERAEVFVHNAGHGGLRGRNGTAELLQAWRLIESPARLILRSQGRQDWPPYPELLSKDIELVQETVPYERLWDSGDVFVFPEKFNGLSLPLQEARAAGLLVVTTDRFPDNSWLPSLPLVEPSSYRRARIGPPYQEFEEAVIDPRKIAEAVDSWYGRDIRDYSESGQDWAERSSWAALGPKYLALLESLL